MKIKLLPVLPLRDIVVFPNMIGLFLLYPKVKNELTSYIDKIKSKTN